MAAHFFDPWQHYEKTHAAKISTCTPYDKVKWARFLEDPEHEGLFCIVGCSRAVVGGNFLWTYEVRCSHWLTLFKFGLQYECDGR